MNRNDDTLAIPSGLSAAGRKAADTILAVLRHDERMHTGGCRAFITPALAIGLGYRNVRGAELVVQHDGGDLRDYFDTSDGVYLRDRMYAALNAERFRVEKVNAFSTAIYAD